MNTAPRGEDAQLLARVRAALAEDASSSDRVDADRVWSSVRTGVPARRRRRTAQRAALAGGVVAVVVVAGIGGAGASGWLRALDDRSSPPPATSVSTELSAQDLLPAPLREPRATSTQAGTWVLPAQCTAPAPDLVPAELVTARDGAGTYGSAIDVTQVARFPDPASAASALQALSGAVEQCAAGRSDLGLVPLGGGLTGVEVREGEGGGPGAARVSALVLAGDAVALLTTSGPLPLTAADREQVLDRARSFAGAAATVQTR